MKSKGLLVLFVVICCVLVLGPSPNGAARAEQDPIKIGTLLSLTGPYADYGPDFRAGIELRLDEAGWKVAGRPIKLIIEDDKSIDPAAGLDKTKKLIGSDKIHIMIGPLFTPTRLALEPYVERMKIPNIALSRHVIKAAKEGGWIFLPAGTLRAFSRPMGWYAYEDRGFRKANTMANDNAAGRQYMGGAIDGFKEKGGTVLLEQFPPLPTPDFAPYLVALKKDADVVMTWLAGPDTLNFLKAFFSFGLQEKMKVVLLLAEEFLRVQQMQGFGDNVLGIIGLTDYNWRLDNPLNRKFVSGIEAKTGKKPSPHHSRAYDAASIAIAALEATGGNTDPERLREAIAQVRLDTPSGPLSLNRRGIGIRNMYGAEIQKVEGEYSWVVDRTYHGFTAE